MMNRDEFEGFWHQIRGRVKEKWGQFTNDERTRRAGRREQWHGRLHEHYGQIIRRIQEWDPGKTRPYEV